MYDAAGWEVARGCAERAIDLLQLIASAREVRGEDRVRQLADTRREPVVCTASEVSSVHQSLNDQNAPELESK